MTDSTENVGSQIKTQNTKDEPPKTKKQWIIENVISLGVALLLVFTIRSSLIEAFKIPSGSMIPTLLVGDHIFVNKFAYGLKVPFSDLFGGAPINIIDRDPPKRGDIIVFIFPKDESFYFIKRVIGIPGDTIEVKDKVIYVNGQAVQKDPVPASEAEKIIKSLKEPKYSQDSLELFMEKTPVSATETHPHYVMLDKNSFLAEDHSPILVPAESLFVMGDNRDFSNDSRSWGFVPFKNVKGKALVIWNSMWISFSDGQSAFRPERIGTILH